MNKKGLTISIIFEAQSANYGEGYGNISTLKQLSRGDGNLYTYISRQAIRYNIVEQLGWNNTPVSAEGSGDKQVVQFTPNASITDYPEIDLFGYMKTSKGNTEGATTRNAVVRLSNAISLETYNADTDFLNNMGLARRLTNVANSLAQSEIHKSYYGYTVTIDLERVGVERERDGQIKEEISNEEKAKRLISLLDAIKLLYRDIRGRRENLSPIFIAGGVYENKNPFFLDRLKIKNNKLDLEIINGVLNVDQTVKNNTKFGYVDAIFSNTKEIQETLKPLNINEFFNELKKEVKSYYA